MKKTKQSHNNFFKEILFLLQKVLLFLLKIIYPCRCVSCRNIVENNKAFCISCWKKIQFIGKPYCKICGDPFQFSVFNDEELICGNCLRKKPYFDKAISCFVYNKTIARAIFEFKFFRKTFLKYFFVDFLQIASKDIVDKIDILAPIPLDKKRLRWRGYNQSLLLANELNKRINKIVIPDLLIKTKHTAPQATLNNKNRRKNLKSVFKINEKYIDFIKGKNITLLDDVMTTGTTTNECSKVLKKYEVKSVFVLTIAKTSLFKKENYNIDDYEK